MWRTVCQALLLLYPWQAAAQVTVELNVQNQAILQQLENINKQLRDAASQARVSGRNDLVPAKESASSVAPPASTLWKEIKLPFGGSIKIAVPQEISKQVSALPPTAPPPAAELINYAGTIERDAQRVSELLADLREGRVTDILSRLGDQLVAPETAATLRGNATGTEDTAPSDLGSLVFVQGGDGGFTMDHAAVGLLLHHGNGNHKVCTGTLVRANAVLTAAHCICPPGTIGAPFQDTAQKCRLWIDRPDAGEYSFFMSGGGLARGIAFRVHDQYSFFSLKGDLAIFEIEPVSGIEPMQIADEAVTDGMRGRLIGYGMRAIRPPLQVAAAGGAPAAVPLSGDAEAQARSTGLKLFGLQNAQGCPGANEAFCWRFETPAPTLPTSGAANGPEHSISCPGDSGGPFLVPIVIGGIQTWRVGGVISAGSPVACGASTTAYNMNLGRDLHRNWLSAQLQGIPTPSSGSVRAMRLNKSDPFRFAALEQPSPTVDGLGSYTRTIEIEAETRWLRVGLNAADLRSGGPLVLEFRSGSLPESKWSTCQELNGTSQVLVQGGLQMCEISSPPTNRLEVRVTGRLGREIQLLATQWSGP